MIYCRFNDNIIISKLFHVSDIHIRLYSRIKEYKYVFNKLFKYIYDYKKQHKEEYNLIIITGDLFHSKNELSPEAILMASYFLKNLTKIYPVILIAGNHDALLNNNNRIDAISALLINNNDQYKNLFYFKYSGVYQVNNILFCVSSLIDNMHISYNYIKRYINNDEKLKKFKIIGLYHGAVEQVITDVGYRLKGNKLLKDFIGYDYVLLGDIHKYQYVDKNKRVGYASSLICQNFGETDSQHGVLVWDLLKNYSEYYNIYNPYGYKKFYYKHEFNLLLINQKTYKFDDKSLNLLNEQLPNFIGNIKIISDTSDVIINNNVNNLIKKTFPHCKISYNIESPNNTKSKDNIIDNISSAKNNWKLLIKQFYDYNDKYSSNNPNYIDDIYNIFIDLFVNDSKSLTNVHNVNNNRWDIIYIKFDNFFTYGLNNYINLESFDNNTIAGIFAKNSYGKSSLIDIITFILFSKITRYHSVGISKDIININENTAYGEIVFKLGYKYYKIIKHLKRIKFKNTLKISIIKEDLLESYDIEFKDSKLLNGDHRLKTDKIITDLIGTYEQFIFSSIQLQSKEKLFKDLTNKEKKDFLIKHLKLDFFNEKFIMKVTDDYKECKYIYDTLIKKISNININELLAELNNSLKKRNNLETELKSLINEQINIKKQIQVNMSNIVHMCDLENDIIILNNKIKDNRKILDNIEHIVAEKYNDTLFGHLSCEFNTEILKLRKNMNLIRNNIVTTSKELKNIHTIDNKYDNYENIVKDINLNEEKIKIYSNKVDDINNDVIITNIGTLTRKIDDINDKIVYNEDQKEKLNLLEMKCTIYEDLFNLYKQSFNKSTELHYINELRKVNDILIKIKQLYDENKEIEKNNKLINQKIISDENEMSNIMNKINELSINNCVNDFIKDRDKLLNEKNQLLAVSNELLNLKMDKEKIIESKIFEFELNKDLEKINHRLEQEILNNTSKLKELNIIIDDLESKKNDYDNMVTTLTSSKYNLSIYKFLIDFVGINGISLLLLRTYLPNITKKVNDILVPYTNRKIELELDNDNIIMSSYNLNKTVSTSNISVSLYGGMESFILDIAFKIVLGQLSIIPKSNLLIIDEGISVLDSSHIANISFLFDFLKNFYDKILLITHLNEVKSDVDNIINISKNDINQSKISVY